MPHTTSRSIPQAPPRQQESEIVPISLPLERKRGETITVASQFCVDWHEQFRHPCSAQVPHDSATRFLRACLARNTRMPALLGEMPCAPAKTVTGVSFTSMACNASAYSGLSVAARRDTQAQI